MCVGWSLEISVAFRRSVVRQDTTNQPTTWLAAVNAGYLGEYFDRAAATHSPTRRACCTSVIDIFFAPVTIAMRPVNASGETLYTACPPRGTSFRANNIVLQLRIISSQIDRRAFREWVIRAHHRHRNLVRTPRVGHRQMSVVLSTPHRSRCGNSSRAVNSYEPLGGESRSACKGRGCAIIGKSTVAKSARDKVLRPFIGIPSVLAKPTLIQRHKGCCRPVFCFCRPKSRLISG